METTIVYRGYIMGGCQNYGPFLGHLPLLSKESRNFIPTLGLRLRLIGLVGNKGTESLHRA